MALTPVQSDLGFTNFSATTTVTMTVAAGHGIILRGMSVFPTTATVSFSTDKSDVCVVDEETGGAAAIGHIASCVGGTTVFTLTWSSAGNRAILIVEELNGPIAAVTDSDIRTDASTGTYGLSLASIAVGDYVAAACYCAGNFSAVTNGFSQITAGKHDFEDGFGIAKIAASTTETPTFTTGAVVSAGMAAAAYRGVLIVHASDSFNRANGALTGSTLDNALGGTATVTWTDQVGTWNIASNAATVSSSGAAVTLDVSPADEQQVSAVVGGSLDAGVMVRWNPGGYFYMYHAANGSLYRVDGYGNYVGLGTSTVATAGDTIRIHAYGSLIKCYLNDVEKISLTSVAPGLGKPGLFGSTNPTFDSFVYEVESPPTGAPVQDGEPTINEELSGIYGWTSATNKTTAGSNRYVRVVMGGLYFGSVASGTRTATYGGTAMTKLWEYQVDTVYTIAFGLVNPPTTASAIVVSGFTDAFYGQATCESWKNVDQTTPTRTAGTAGSNVSGPATVTVASSATDTVVDAVTAYNQAKFLGVDQRFLAAKGFAQTSYKYGDASTEAMTHTGGSNLWVIGAISLRASGGIADTEVTGVTVAATSQLYALTVGTPVAPTPGDRRVTELPAIDVVMATDLLMVIDNPAGTPVNKKATVLQVAQAIAQDINWITVSLGGSRAGSLPLAADTYDLVNAEPAFTVPTLSTALLATARIVADCRSMDSTVSLTPRLVNLDTTVAGTGVACTASSADYSGTNQHQTVAVTLVSGQTYKAQAIVAGAGAGTHATFCTIRLEIG